MKAILRWFKKDMLDKEFKYFVDHQNDLVQKYSGRYIVIKDALTFPIPSFILFIKCHSDSMITY